MRSIIGVTGQFAAVDELLTGRENLHLMGDLHHLPGQRTKELAQELLDRFALTDAGDKPASTYSGDMTRRFDLAMTLVGDPCGGISASSCVRPRSGGWPAVTAATAAAAAPRPTDRCDGW